MAKLKKWWYGTDELGERVIRPTDFEFQIFKFVRPPLVLDIDPAHAKKVKITKFDYGVTNLGLRVIWHEDFKFRIIDLVRAPVDREPTQPTQNVQNEKIQLWKYWLRYRGNSTRGLWISHHWLHQTISEPWTLAAYAKWSRWKNPILGTPALRSG